MSNYVENITKHFKVVSKIQNIEFKSMQNRLMIKWIYIEDGIPCTKSIELTNNDYTALKEIIKKDDSHECN